MWKLSARGFPGLAAVRLHLLGVRLPRALQPSRKRSSPPLWSETAGSAKTSVPTPKLRRREEQAGRGQDDSLSFHDPPSIRQEPELTASRFSRGCGGRGSRGSSSLERSEEHTSELQSHSDLVCRLLLEKKNNRHLERNRPHYS